jgi:hypothetical protein
MSTYSKLLTEHLKNLKPEDAGFALLWQIKGFLEAREKKESDEKLSGDIILEETERDINQLYIRAEKIIEGYSFYMGMEPKERMDCILKIISLKLDYMKFKNAISIFAEKIAEGISNIPSVFHKDIVKKDSYLEFVERYYGSMQNDSMPEKPPERPIEPWPRGVTLKADIEQPLGPPITGNEFNIEKLRTELLNHDYAMKVLCRDETGKIDIVKSAKEVKYEEEAFGYYRTLSEDEPGYAKAVIGFLIESE